MHWLLLFPLVANLVIPSLWLCMVNWDIVPLAECFSISLIHSVLVECYSWCCCDHTLLWIPYGICTLGYIYGYVALGIPVHIWGRIDPLHTLAYLRGNKIGHSIFQGLHLVMVEMGILALEGGIGCGICIFLFFFFFDLTVFPPIQCFGQTGGLSWSAQIIWLVLHTVGATFHTHFFISLSYNSYNTVFQIYIYGYIKCSPGGLAQDLSQLLPDSWVSEWERGEW